MATKKKQTQLSKRHARKMRTQQIIMGVIAVILILAFIIPYLVS